MKKALLLIFLLNCGIGISQTEFPFYEQIALDFYQSTIIDSFPQNKKVKVYPYVINFHPSTNEFNNPICLGMIGKRKNEFKELESYVETQIKIDSDRFELDFSNLDKKKFKIKKRGEGNYPRLKITPPNINIYRKDRVFVNIHITNKCLYETFHIEFNEKGEIIDWCRSHGEVIRVH